MFPRDIIVISLPVYVVRSCDKYNLPDDALNHDPTGGQGTGWVGR